MQLNCNWEFLRAQQSCSSFECRSVAVTRPCIGLEQPRPDLSIVGGADRCRRTALEKKHMRFIKSVVIASALVMGASAAFAEGISSELNQAYSPLSFVKEQNRGQDLPRDASRARASAIRRLRPRAFACSISPRSSTALCADGFVNGLPRVQIHPRSPESTSERRLSRCERVAFRHRVVRRRPCPNFRLRSRQSALAFAAQNQWRVGDPSNRYWLAAGRPA